VDDKHDKYVVNGRHDPEALAKLLDVFIEKFLLCGTCRNPETKMEILKNGNITMRCMACGETTAVDPRHRLAGYITKNPPLKTRYEKAEQKAEQKQNQVAASSSATGEGAAGDGSAQKDVEEGMGSLDLDAAVTASGLSADDEFGDNWNDADFSKGAMDKRRMELLGAKSGNNAESNSVGVLANAADGEIAAAAAAEDPIDALTAFLTKKPAPKSSEILQHVKTTARANGWNESNTLAAVYGALFGKNILDNLKARAPILRIFIHTPSDQKQVLYLTERLCSKDGNAALKISSILNGFYEADILEEEILLKWHKHPTKKIDTDLARALRERTNTFIEWLQTAEDDEDDDGDDDEE